MEASLHRRSSFNHRSMKIQFHLQPLSFPVPSPEVGWGLDYKFQSSNYAWVLLVTSSHPEAVPDSSHVISIQRHCFHSRDSKGLRRSSCVRNWERRPIMYFLLYHMCRVHECSSPLSALSWCVCLVVRSLGQSWCLWNGLRAERSEQIPTLLSAVYPPGFLNAVTWDPCVFFNICVGFWKWKALTIISHSIL